MKILAVFLVSLSCLQAFSSETLKVGAPITPPFVMIDEVTGEQTGLVIDLWKNISRNIDLSEDSYYINVYDEATGKIVERLNKDSLDVLIGAMTVNAHRLSEGLETTIPFFVSSLSIASNVSFSWVNYFFSKAFMKLNLSIFSVILGLIFVMGLIFWRVEMKINPEQFRSYAGDGILDGMFFSFMIVSTIGFGNQYPISRPGKILTIFWGIVAVFILNGIIIANYSAGLMVARLESGVNSISQLNKTKVGSILKTSSADFLNKKGVKFIGYETVEEGLEAIENGELETFVYDTPILKYYISKKGYNIRLSTKTFDQQYYAFGINVDQSLEKQINYEILRFLESDLWDKTLAKYNLN